MRSKHWWLERQICVSSKYCWFEQQQLLTPAAEASNSAAATKAGGQRASQRRWLRHRR